MRLPVDRRATTAFVLALLAAACDPLQTAPEPEPNPIESLEEARAVWESRNVSHYEIDFRWMCFCPPEYYEPVTLEVRDGAVVSGVVQATGESIAPDDLSLYRTVDGLFDFLEEARQRPADSIDTEFDPTFGYPKSAYVDYSAMAVDEEMAFRVDAVRPLR